MKTLISILLLLSPLSSSAFLLIDPNYHLAYPEDTVVNIAAETCPAVGVSNDTLRAAIEISIDQFWNTVSESKLRFRMGDVVSKTSRTQVSSGEILIGCSSTSPGNGGGTTNDNASGTAHILLDSQIAAAGFDRIVGVVIHEMGHAVGLNHSADSSSVMTYETHGWGLRPSMLSQDDKFGVIFLYPVEGKVGGLVPGCSVKANQKASGHDIALAIMQELLGLFSVLVIFKIIKKSFQRLQR